MPHFSENVVAELALSICYFIKSSNNIYQFISISKFILIIANLYIRICNLTLTFNRIFFMEVMSNGKQNSTRDQQTKNYCTFDEKPIFSEEIKRMVNGHEVSKIFYRFITLQKSYGLCLSIQLVLTVLYYELDYLDRTETSNLILGCLNLAAAPSIILSMLAHFSYNDWKTSELKEHQTLSGYQLIFNCIVILVQPYMMFQSIYINNYDMKGLKDVEYKLNYVMVIGSLLKVCLLLPSLMNMLKFKNPRSSRVCKIYGCSNSNLYSIKCYFKQSPIKLVVLIFLVCILIFSYGYRVSERNVTMGSNPFQYYTNAVWLVVVTMTSVGFGDFYPQTVLGRIVGFFCTFCGVMTVSIMVLVVINTFELDQNQSKSLRILKKLQQKKQIKEISANYLRLSLWRIWNNFKNKKNDKYCKLTLQTRDEKILRNLLRQKIRISKFLDSGIIDLGHQMNRQFEKIQYNVQSIKQNSDSIISYLSNQYFINIEEIKDQSKLSYSFTTH